MKSTVAAFFLMLVAACTATQQPVAELSAARSAIAQARSLAGRYAAAELRSAEAKLARAEAASRSGSSTEARRLAEQAEVDARFALSVAENERSRRASAELAKSVDELRRELEGRAR